MTVAQNHDVPRSRTGLFLLASITILWGCNWPMLKIAVSEMPVFTFRSISLASGIVGMFLVCWMEKKSWRLPRRDILPCFFAAMTTITSWNLASTLGLQHMAPGRASILAFTMPLWAALMAVPMLHERLTRLRVIGLTLGLAGVALLIWPARASLAVDPLGPIYMIAAAISWALGTVVLKMHRWSAPLATVTAWQFAIGTLPVVAGALIVDRGFSLHAVDLRGWSAVFYASIVCTVYCYWAWFRVVDIYPATVAAIGTLGIPVVGVFSSAAVLGEPIGFSEIGALVLVVSALVTVLILPELQRRPRTAPAYEIGQQAE
jgi:drug/metabolite transporter (DMT)-like permease